MKDWLAVWDLPPDASLHGWRIDFLLGVTTVFVAIMFLATIVWILYSCVFHGKRHRAHHDHGTALPTVVKALCLSGLIFVLVYGNLAVSGLADVGDVFWNYEAGEADPRAVRVQVNAHQWAWDMRMAGPDGAFGTADDVVTLNELRVPVGRPILFQLAATDVIHSFSLPHMRVKQDAVPGSITRLWFVAKDTGTFEIACAQHCGVNHYKMRGRLVVMPGAAWDAWMKEAAALAAAAHDPDDETAHWAWPWERGRK